MSSGLHALSDNEPIHRARTENEHALGNAGGVNNALSELTCVLAGSVDDGFENLRAVPIPLADIRPCGRTLRRPARASRSPPPPTNMAER